MQSLTNEQATRRAITDGIEGVLASSSAGDVVVIQYAGHGTQLPDLNGDESDGFDEAWVPCDFGDGEFVIDDDLGELFDRSKDRGIQLVVFTDCCHSGTSTRFMPPRGARQANVRSRYMSVPRDLVELYKKKRGVTEPVAPSSGQDGLGWEIHFAACQDRQSAYERDGHGDFTRAATQALADALRAPLTYAGLAEKIAAAFAGNALQTPQLRAGTDAQALAMFAATRDAAAASDAGAPGNSALSLNARIDELAAAIKQLSKKIDEL